MARTELNEAAVSWAEKPKKIDAEKGLIEDVLLLGLSAPSKKRQYTTSALQKAVGLFEGAQVNLGPHAKLGEEVPFNSRFGRTKNARFVEGQGIRGDIQFNPHHEAAKKFVWWAENDPKAIGCSPRQLGTCRMQGGVEFVEEIAVVRSVDLVTDPATTKGLYEDQSEGGIDPPQPQPKGGSTVEYKDLSLDDLKKQRPDLVKSLTESKESETQLTALQAQVKTLNESLDAEKAKNALVERKQLVETKLAAAKLPAPIVTDTFKAQLVEAKDEKAIDTLIEDRKLLGKATKVETPKSGSKSLHESTGTAEMPEPKSFVDGFRRA